MSQDAKETTAIARTAPADPVAAMTVAAGINIKEFDMFDAEVIQTGGLTKWVDLRAFMADPKAGDREAVAGNGKAFAGVLISRQEIPVNDKDSGELNADGIKVRFYYTLRLISECPVAYRDENKDEVKEVAQAGEIVAIGERNKLVPLRELCEDGGVYALIIKPHSRIKIGKGQTMWTFDLVKKTIKPAAKLTVVGTKNPF